MAACWSAPRSPSGPDLFGAAIPEVGVLDMLRFQKFTVGKAWVTDYGSPKHRPTIQVPVRVLAVSQRQRRHALPADDGDDLRPRRPRLSGALVQVRGGATARTGGRRAVLLRVESKAGHGGGRPTEKIIDDVADRFAFLMKDLDFTPKL